MSWKLVKVGLIFTASVALFETALAEGAMPELHRRLLALALDNLDKAMCGTAQCSAATIEERTHPPLTHEQVAAIVAAGTVSVAAEHCQLDWRVRNFLPMMRRYREISKLSDRQMALISMLHGITMGALADAVQRTPCSSEMKATIDKKLIGQ